MLSIATRVNPSCILLPSVRVQKEENKVANLIHLFCCHLASECSSEEALVRLFPYRDRCRNMRRNWRPIWIVPISRERFPPSRRTASCSSVLAVGCTLRLPFAENAKLKGVLLRHASGAQSGTVVVFLPFHL